MTHTCRESPDPRCKGRCACGKKITHETDGVSEDLMTQATEVVRQIRGDKEEMREFDTGATRDTDEGKYDYAGFLSPYALERYAEYMHKHRVQSDGTLRDSNNWKKGIPRDAYMSSAFRHFMEWWSLHEADEGASSDAEEALCALLFNCMGYLHAVVKPWPA